MSLEQDVAAARTAVDELERACARVLGHFSDTVDSRRLRTDVNRLREDLTLLCGREPVAARSPQFPYVAWDDGMDDGRDDGSASAPGRMGR